MTGLYCLRRNTEAINLVIKFLFWEAAGNGVNVSCFFTFEFDDNIFLKKLSVGHLAEVSKKRTFSACCLSTPTQGLQKLVNKPSYTSGIPNPVQLYSPQEAQFCTYPSSMWGPNAFLTSDLPTCSSTANHLTLKKLPLLLPFIHKMEGKKTTKTRVFFSQIHDLN